MASLRLGERPEKAKMGILQSRHEITLGKILLFGQDAVANREREGAISISGAIHNQDLPFLKRGRLHSVLTRSDGYVPKTPFISENASADDLRNAMKQYKEEIDVAAKEGNGAAHAKQLREEFGKMNEGERKLVYRAVATLAMQGKRGFNQKYGQDKKTITSLLRRVAELQELHRKAGYEPILDARHLNRVISSRFDPRARQSTLLKAIDQSIKKEGGTPPKTYTRREFLKAAGYLGGGALLATKGGRLLQAVGNAFGGGKEESTPTRKPAGKTGQGQTRDPYVRAGITTNEERYAVDVLKLPVTKETDKAMEKAKTFSKQVWGDLNQYRMINVLSKQNPDAGQIAGTLLAIHANIEPVRELQKGDDSYLRTIDAVIRGKKIGPGNREYEYFSAFKRFVTKVAESYTPEELNQIESMTSIPNQTIQNEWNNASLRKALEREGVTFGQQ